MFGLAHGHQIAKHLQRTSGDVLQVERWTWRQKRDLNMGQTLNG
jgi:hypothetical protein